MHRFISTFFGGVYRLYVGRSLVIGRHKSKVYRSRRKRKRGRSRGRGKAKTTTTAATKDSKSSGNGKSEAKVASETTEKKKSRSKKAKPKGSTSSKAATKCASQRDSAVEEDAEDDTQFQSYNARDNETGE
jgi:hypothetical protein